MRYMLLNFLLVLTALTAACSQRSCENLVKDGLGKYVCTVPPQCRVQYDETHEAQCGNKIPVTSVLFEPTITYNVNDRFCNLATIIMIGPDAPPTHSPYLLFKARNIPSNAIRGGYKSWNSPGDVEADYEQPKGVLNSRFLVCIYCQTEYERPEKYILIKRWKFDMKKYAENHNICAIACNYFKLEITDLL